MASIEKINISVSEEMLQNILHDCEYFHITQKKNNNLNKNRFFNLLVNNYHEEIVHKFDQRYKEIEEAIKATLYNKNLKEDEIKNIAQSFTQKMTKIKEEEKQEGVKYKKISYNPNKEAERVLKDSTKIDFTNKEDKVAEDAFCNYFDSYGSYFNTLLLDYFSEPMAKRETILYKENYDKLVERCQNQDAITITTRNKKSHKIIPYKLVQGHNGMFTYLLCGEAADTFLNNEPNVNKVMEARCYHLYAIEHVDLDKSNNQKLTKQVKQYLKMMMKKGPEHAINASEKAIIRMNEDGHELFQRVYNDRPIPDGKPEKDGDYYLYKFSDISTNQLFFYFRRFGPDAEILEPKSLRDRLINFYEKSLASYK